MKRIVFLFLLLAFLSNAAKISPAVFNYLGDRVPVLIYYNSPQNLRTSLATLSAVSDIRISYVYEHIPVIFAEVPKTRINLLEKDKNIKFVSTDIVYRPLLQDSVNIIRAVNLTYNNISLNGSGIKVAVIDTGVDYTHPDLNGSVVLNESYDFVDDDADPMDLDGHGTHVAGIIAAHGNITGVAPGAKLLAIRVCGSRCYLSDILKGIDWALEHNADVLSLSLGTFPNPAYLPDGSLILSTVLSYVSNKTIPVIAAGNSYEYGVVSSPGDGLNVITVGAIDKSNDLADFSSKGILPPGRVKPDLSAPGVNINSTYLNNTYEYMSGTSMATPHVSGAVALLLQAYPEWKGNTTLLRAVLKEGSDYLSGYYPSEIGSGRLNVSGSLNLPLLVLPDEVDVSLRPGNLKLFNLTIRKLIPGNLSINVSVVPARYINLARCSNATYSFVFVNSSFNLTENESSIILNISVPNTTAPGYYEGYILITPNNSKQISIPYVVSVIGADNTSFSVCGGYVYDSYSAHYYYDTFYVNLNLTVDYYRVFLTLNSSPEYMYLTGPDGRVLNISTGLNHSFLPWINGTYILTIVPNGTVGVNITFELRELNITPESLHFLVHSVDSATKNITIYNPFSENITVFLDYIEASTENVAIQPDSFILLPNESINISVTLRTNDTSMFGRYAGVLVVNYSGVASRQESIPVVFDIILPINLTFNFSVENHWLSDIDFVSGFYISQPANVDYYTITAKSSCYWSILLYDMNDILVKNITISGRYPYVIRTLNSGLWYLFMIESDKPPYCQLNISIKGTYLPSIVVTNSSGQTQQGFLPGDTINVSYSASSETGYVIKESGRLYVYFPNGTLYLSENITIPSNFSFTLSNHSVSGYWTIKVSGTDYVGTNETVFYVGQKPTSIFLDVLPGVLVNSSINIIPRLLDQAGDVILNRTIMLNITLPNGTVEVYNVSSNISLTYVPSLIGKYNITATYENITSISGFLVDTLNDINISVNDTYLEPLEPLNLSIALLNSSGDISWIVRDITVVLTDPNNLTWNYTVNIYGSENISLNLPEHPAPGNWTVIALDSEANVSSNSVQFHVNVSFNYSVAELLTQYNVSVESEKDICFYINNTGNEVDNFSVNVLNLTWDHTISPQRFSLSPGNTKEVCVNITVPFVAAGTLENFTLDISTEYYGLNKTYEVSLKVKPYINFSVLANKTSFFGFSIPSSLPVNLTFENLANQNISINCSFTQGAYIHPPVDFPIVLNMSESDNKIMEFNVSVGAYEDEYIYMNCSSGNVTRSIKFLFSPPRLTVYVSTPDVDDDNYPETGTVRVPVDISYSGTDISIDNLAQKTCIVRNGGVNKTGTMAGSGTSIYCEFTEMDSWDEGEYTVYVEVRDNYNRTGKDTGSVFVPKDISGGSISLDDSSVCVGESTVLRGQDFIYSSGYYVDGTVDVYIDSTKVGTYSVTNGDFSTTIPGRTTTGSYIVKAMVHGVWGISTQVTRTLNVYNCTGGSGGASGSGGGGGGSESPPPISLENSPNIKEYDSFKNPVTYGLRVTGLIGNYSVEVQENSSYQHFDIIFPEKVKLTGDNILNITIRPFRYVKPGNYTVIVKIGSHEYRFSVNVPHPSVNHSKINTFRYVEYYAQANITKMYVEVYNPLNEEKEIQIIENISKSIVPNANQIIRFGEWYIIQEDPVLGYNVTLNPNETVYLRYNLVGNFVNTNFSEPVIVLLNNPPNESQQNISENASTGVLSGKVRTVSPESENKTEETPLKSVPEKPVDNTIWYVLAGVLVFGGVIIILILKGHKRWKEQKKSQEFQKLPETQEKQEFPIDKLFEKP